MLMGVNILNVTLVLSRFRFSLCTSFPLSSTFPPSPPLSMSVCWFMALFKRRPHVSPNAAICFNPASFFHSEAKEEPTKINPWLTLSQHSVFCGFSHGCVCFRGTWRGFTRVPLTKCLADPARFCCCWEHTSDIEKWHATRMPLIMFRGKVGKMADVTRPCYQPNFIREIHVWAGKSGYFFPASSICKQLLNAEVYGLALAVSGYEFQPRPFFYIHFFYKHWHNRKIRHSFSSPTLELRLQHNSLHFLDETFF